MDLGPVIAAAVLGLLALTGLIWCIANGVLGWLILLSVFMLMAHWEGHRFP